MAAMTKNITYKIMALLIFIVFIFAILIGVNSPSKNKEFSDKTRIVNNNGNSTMQEEAVNSKLNGQPDEIQIFMTEMINKLREMHGHNVQDVSVQLSFQDFKVFILETYPDNGAALFESIILQAFPLYGNRILELIANMHIYNEWMAENQLFLSELYTGAREEKIWSKRTELFGELSFLIFSDQKDKEQQRQVTVMKTVDRLDQATDMSMDERLFLLTSIIQENYSGAKESLLVDKGLMSDMYFNLSSVQQDLKELSEIDRQEQINHSREQLGFSKKDMDFLAKKDAKNETRWKNGYSYMQQRDSLSDSLSGDELTSELVKLRHKMFKHEATTIAKEEEQGFYRYERPRLYGKN
jgi:hypothetical protein